MRILLVEDNARLAALITDGLSAQGYAVDWSENLGSARHALEISSYDLLLVDLGLPDGDGLELIRSMRRGKNPAPVLVLTARGGLDDRVVGLDAGADDYLVKPFQMPELAARCRALLRRPNVSLNTVLSSGNVTLDPATRSISVSETPIEATPREVTLLESLLRREGQVVARTALENSLYAMSAEVTPNALEATMSRLRKRLAANSASIEIKTVHGIGYALYSRKQHHD